MKDGPPVAAQDCTTMTQVRREIDRLDRGLVRLLAERQTYIERAGQIKADRGLVRDEARIEAVLAKIKAEAGRTGLSHSIAEPVWKLLIERSIAHEYEVYDRKRLHDRRLMEG